MKSEEIRKALGQTPEHRRTANMLRVFYYIFQKPSSFTELQEELCARTLPRAKRMAKSTLWSHLEFLEKKAHAIYRETIKANQTTNEEKIGDALYYATFEEVPIMIQEVLSSNLLSLIEPFEDNEPDWKLSKHKNALDRKLEAHKQAIVKALSDYMNLYKIKRDEAYRLEVANLKESLKRDLENKPSEKRRARKKRES